MREDGGKRGERGGVQYVDWRYVCYARPAFVPFGGRGRENEEGVRIQYAAWHYFIVLAFSSSIASAIRAL